MSTPSPSTVAYLFADRFVLTAKPGTSGMKAFGSGAVVDTAELAAGLVAIAVWQLREMGVVTLEAYHAKRLGFISTSGVRVRLVGDAALSGMERRCYDELARSRKARAEGMSAWDLANMVCRDGRDPNGAIIAVAINDAVRLGYLERVAQSVGIVGRVSGAPSTTLNPMADRIAALAPEADALSVQWRDFRQGPEAEMVKLLRSTVYDGIQVRARRSRDDD